MKLFFIRSILGICILMASISAQVVYDPFQIETSPHINMSLLESEIRRMLMPVNAKVVFGAYHVQSGKSIFINGNKKFPMASTAKLFFATTFLNQVENKQLDLKDSLSINEKTLRPYSSFSKMMLSPKVTLDAKSALESMITVSDNTSSDLIFNQIGKAEGIKSFFSKKSIENINVSRSILDLIYSIEGLSKVGRNYEPLTAYRKAKYGQNKKQEEDARKRFFRDKKDTASAKSFVNVLTKLVKNELLSEDNSRYLLRIMARSENKSRIGGLLPGISVANKTGSFSNVSNDVGVVALPYDKGDLIVVASIIEENPERLSDSLQLQEARDKLIALLTKTVYDFIVYQ